MPLKAKTKKVPLNCLLSAIPIFLSILFLSITSNAELKIESVYPTLGVMGQDLEVEVAGTGFDVNTRVSMYLDSGNQMMLVGSLHTGFCTYDVFVSGSYAYVVDFLYGFKVVDISDSSDPQIIGSVNTPGNAASVFVSGSYAYVTEWGNGLQVIDISDPSSPQIIGTVGLPSDGWDVFVSGSYAYVADYQSGLQVIDISDPSSPQIIGSVDTPDYAHEVFVSGSYAYVADRYYGLQVIDISDPSSPQVIGYVDTPGDAQGVFVSGSYAYVGDARERLPSGGGLHVIDISDPSSPQIIGSVNTSSDALDVFVSGSYAYVADWAGGLQVIDVSDPSNPQIIGSVDMPPEAQRVFVSGSHAYVADRFNGLQVIDISNPKNSQIMGSVDTVANALDVFLSGSYAYVTDSSGYLYVIDISDPSSPQIIGSVKTPGQGLRVFVSGSYAYVAADGGYLQVFDISNPVNPKLTASVSAPGDCAAYDIFVSENYAYMADRFNGLHVIDISDPSSPQIMGSVNTPYTPWGVFVSGSYAYVADISTNIPNGLQVINISDPSSPQIIGSVDLPIGAHDVSVSGSYAYVANRDAGLQVIDISDPLSPKIIGSVGTPGVAQGVFVSDDYAYVADGNSGLQMIDISDPSNPRIIGSVDTCNATGVFISGDYAYLSDWSAGFVIVPLPVEITPVTMNNDTSISVTLPSPPKAAIYTLRVFNETENYELPGAVSFTNDPNILKSKAIIVAGGGPEVSGGTMWEETKINANKAYDVLILQGYQHDSIYYISEEVLNDYVDNNSPETFLSDLSATINVWAADASQLLIYLVDHGGEDEFILYSDGDTNITLSANDLDDWLDTLQETMTGPVTVIYDACLSGSFISKLRPPEGKERVVITGSSFEPAYFLENGKESFSFHFWDKIVFNRGNLGKAFSYARDVMQSYQSALIEANWDSEGNNNEGEDINIAENITIQRGGYANNNVYPFISSVSDPQVLSSGTTATIQASGIIDSESIKALIIPPDVNPETSDIPITDLPEIELTDPDGDRVYEGVYDVFDTDGTYVVVVKSKATLELYSYVNNAVITQDIYSPPVYTAVTKLEGNVKSKPDQYEGDSNYNQASVIVINDDAPQVHNFHSMGDVDWIKFYGVSGEIYKIKASNVSIFCDPVIELFDNNGSTLIAGPVNSGGLWEDESLEWSCQEDGVYYVRITNANSNFGENVKYDLKVYLPIQGLPGWLTGIVANSLGEGLGGAIIKSDISTATTITHDDGAYFIVLPSGTHTLSVEMSGYLSDSEEGVVIESEGYTTRDIILFSDVDSDNDGTPDYYDECDSDPYKSEVGQCGCGLVDTDTDVDGTADCNDNCPLDPDKTEPGFCGCGQGELDNEPDGMIDCWEEENGLDTTSNDAKDDLDGDGFSNITEYRVGTDPLDPDSHPSKGLPWLMLLLED
ncbi:C13 family peptidase [Thermodesulfobacteriota bacterium]